MDRSSHPVSIHSKGKIRPWTIRDELNITVGHAPKLRAIWGWLQCRYLPVIRAGCARIHSATGVALRFCLNKSERPGGKACAFVLRQAISLLTKLRNLAFEITFLLGQRVLFLLERRVRLLKAHTRILNANDAVIDGRHDLSQLLVVPGVDGRANHCHGAAQGRNGACDCFDHGGLPVGESAGVGTANSTDGNAPTPIPCSDEKVQIGPLDV